MADVTNPYDPPKAERPSASCTDRRLTLALAWPLVFAFNAIFPTLMIQGWQLTRDHGQLGVAGAAIVLLTGGWVFCCVRPASARSWLIGASVLGLGQLVPLVQLQLAWLALSVTESLQLMQKIHLELGDQPGSFASEAGGFVFTLTLGVSLMLVAGALGMASVAWRRYVKTQAASKKAGG